MSDPAEPPLLSCYDVVVRRGTRPALDHVSFVIERGEMVSVVGPNGSGKTTLLHAILGLLPVNAGAIKLGGRSVATLAASVRARIAAYVPQRLDCSPAFSVRDVVATGRFAFSDGDGPAAIKQAIEQCGLTPLADRRFDTLSGGERQKALIAAALAQNPQLLCLDEPNTALDPAYQIELVKILRRCHAGGRSILLVSHDLNLPAVLGGRVIALREGHVVADAPAGEVLQPQCLAAIYGAAFDLATTADGTVLVAPTGWNR
jgi:iron complex transport system ATP-binding protein